MTKHRSVVTGWDPDYINPDTSTGRPKGVQTAPDMRIATTYDVLAEGIFAKYGIPTITGSPTNSATISPFQAAIAASNGGFYIVTIDANESFTINLSNVGAVKIYVQQQDYETDNTKTDSAVVIGVVYGATAIPAGSLLLFTTTITSQTSTNGLTFTPAFKYTGAASGMIQVPTKNDLANVSVITTGMRALVTNDSTTSNNGEYFYNGSAWEMTTVSNPAVSGLASIGWIPVSDTWSFSSWDATRRIGVVTVPTDATTKYSAGMRVKISQATGGTKYAIITYLTATTLTLHFPVSVTLNNEAITSRAFSMVQSPLGFPRNPASWYIYTRVTSQSSVAYSGADVWYNLAGIKVDLGAGSWNVEQKMHIQHTASNVPFVSNTSALSTSSSSPSDPDATFVGMLLNISLNQSDSTHKATGTFTLTANGSVYQLISSRIANAGMLYINGWTAYNSWIRAISAYL